MLSSINHGKNEKLEKGVKEILQQLGIGKDTYYNYLIKYPDFSDALSGVVLQLILKELARDGFSDKQIYQQLGISKDTYYKYIKKYPDFSDALKKGRKPINILVEEAFLSRCLGYEYTESMEE